MSFKHLKQHWLLPTTAVLVVGPPLTSFGCSTIGQANPVTSKVSDHTVYSTDRYGFQFSYAPTQFVVVSQSSRSNDVSLLNMIDIWTKQDYQRINSSEYLGDYPPNVRISVHRNPGQLALKQWIGQNDWLVNPKNFQEQTIAGRKGLFFTSSGLYQQENLIFKHPRNNTIVLISFAKTNGNRNTAVYQKAFNEVLKSFKLTTVAQPNKAARLNSNLGS